MRRGQTQFALAGLGVATAAVLLAAWFGGSPTAQATSLIAAGVLAVGDTLAALWAAGPEERRRALLEWARCGLVAAVLTFVGLYVIVIPTLFAALAAAANGQTLMMYGVLALAAVGGALVVWGTHRFAWRRVAPKAGA